MKGIRSFLWITIYAALTLVMGTYWGMDRGDQAWAENNEETGLFAANPGGDRPDDSYRYGEALYPTDLEHLASHDAPDSRVGVLERGYNTAATALVGLTLPPRRVLVSDLKTLSPPNGSIDKSKPSLDALVIPSGGLAAAGGAPLPGDALQSYVKGGGIVIVLAQPFGGDFEDLPVTAGADKVGGYGWLEDQSLFAQSAYSVSQWSPVSSLKKGRFFGNVDGILSAYPKGSSILLRHAVSGEPIMVMYRYGKGLVLATTLFTDWAFVHQRASKDEVDLFGRILAWAQSPNRFSDFNPGEDNPAPFPDFTYAILSDQEVYTLGSTATFTITVWNRTNRERTVNVYYETQGQKLQLPPGRPTRIRYGTKIQSSHRLWVYFHDEQGHFMETLTRGVQVLFTPPVGVRLINKNLDRGESLHPGMTVDYGLTLSGRSHEGKKTRVELKVFDPEHHAIHEETFPVLFEAGHDPVRDIHVAIPPDAMGGSYLVSVSVSNEAGEKVGGESSTFDLPMSLISVTPEFPKAITTQKKASFIFILKNSGKAAVEKGGLSLSVQDPAGQTLYEASLPFALKAGEAKPLQFPVAFPEILLGDYLLTVTQWDETRRGVPVVLELPNVLESKVFLNQTTYRERDKLELSLKVNNPGPFEMDHLAVSCAIPKLSFHNSQEVSLSGRSETTLFFRFQVPDVVDPGTHEIKATFTSSASSTSKTFPLDVPVSTLAVMSRQPSYHPGEKVLVTLSNSGGVATEATVHMTLRDPRSAPAADQEQRLSVPAGGSLPVYLPLPAELASGKYTLNIDYHDLKTDKSGAATQVLQILR